MFQLDLPTLSIVMSTAAAFAVLVMVTIWRINRTLAGIRWWAACALCATVGLLPVLVTRAGWLPYGVAMLASNALLLMAVLLLLEGTLRFKGHLKPHRWRHGLWLVPLMLALLWRVRGDELTTIVLRDAFFVLVLLSSALVMARPPAVGNRLSNAFNAIALLVMALAMTARGWIALDMDSALALRQHPINGLVYLVTVFFLMGWTYSVHMACYLSAHRTIDTLDPIDGATGLLKGHALMKHLQHAIARSERSGIQFCYLLIHLDGLGWVAQTQGTATVAQVHQAMSERLRNFTRAADLASHLGHDQFALLIHHMPDQQHLRGAIARLRQALAQPFHGPSGQTLPVQPSLGMAIWPLDGSTSEALLNCAHQRMQAERMSLLNSGIDESLPG